MGKESPTDRRVPRRTWNAHTKKIILTSSLVVVPMVAFTVALLSMVFANRVNLDHCPHSSLCPYTDGSSPANSSDYYVDISVGRLAFVSSLSSSISFTLVAATMSLYGYIVARDMISVSKFHAGSDDLPNAYGTSAIIRILNAEMAMVWDMLVQVYEKAARNHQGRLRQSHTRTSRMLRLCRVVFLFSLSAR
jgi:hypothetical protein